MISLPVVVHNAFFEWQLDLFWHNHQELYGDAARDKAKALIVTRNYETEPDVEHLQWGLDVPHVMCQPFFKWLAWDDPATVLDVPLNMQTALAQVVDDFDPDDVLEVLDGDMCHIRAAPVLNVGDDELYVDDIYERWHLRSLDTYRHVVAMYCENGRTFSNGGFVPIIGRARTFKKILPAWVAVHRHILTAPYEEDVHWWAGMFALQAACEKAQVRMIAKDLCYVPAINQLQPSHYVTHYAVDRAFNKRTYHLEAPSLVEDNLFYDLVRKWMSDRERRYDRVDAPSIVEDKRFQNVMRRWIRGHPRRS